MGSCTRCFSHMRSYGMKMGTSRCFESIQRGKLRYPSSARLPMCSYFHSISWQAAINMHLTCTNMHQHAPSSHMSQLPIKLCYVRPIVAFGNLKVGDRSITDWAHLDNFHGGLWLKYMWFWIPLGSTCTACFIMHRVSCGVPRAYGKSGRWLPDVVFNAESIGNIEKFPFSFHMSACAKNMWCRIPLGLNPIRV